MDSFIHAFIHSLIHSFIHSRPPRPLRRLGRPKQHDVPLRGDSCYTPAGTHTHTLPRMLNCTRTCTAFVLVVALTSHGTLLHRHGVDLYTIYPRGWCAGALPARIEQLRSWEPTHRRFCSSNCNVARHPVFQQVFGI